MVRRWAANLVSLSRLALIVPWIISQTTGSLWTLPIMAAIMASDLLDGPIARKFSTACTKGALIDAACDMIVVVAAAVTFGLQDTRYFGLAGLMALTFFSWGIHSLVLGRFAYTRLGKYDGVACYILAATVGTMPRLADVGFSVPEAGEWIFAGFVSVFLGVSVLENIAGIVRASMDIPSPLGRFRLTSLAGVLKFAHGHQQGTQSPHLGRGEGNRP
jgi:phosphatidylglycerophosphate synthase